MRGMAMLMLLPLAACGNASGDGGEASGIAGTGSGNARSYQAAGFTGVDLAGSDDVDVRIGSTFVVRAEGAPEDLDRLRIRVDGDTLKVDRRSRTGMNWGGHKVVIHVTMPRLAEASISGSGSLRADRVEGEEFEGDLAGSGDLVLGAMQVDKASFDIAGSGSVKASGDAGALSIDIAGAGDVEAPELRARSADVSIAGSGNVRAAVAGPAKISIMGSGDVNLGPQARCQTSKMGSGSVRCG